MDAGYYICIVWVVCMFFNLFKIYQAKSEEDENGKLKFTPPLHVFAIVFAPIFTAIQIFFVIFIKPWGHLKNFDN